MLQTAVSGTGVPTTTFQPSDLNLPKTAEIKDVTVDAEGITVTLRLPLNFVGVTKSNGHSTDSTLLSGVVKTRKKRVLSEEAKQKISDAQRKRWANRENREASDETKAKIAASQRARWAGIKGTGKANTRGEVKSPPKEEDCCDKLTYEIVSTSSNEQHPEYAGDKFSVTSDGHFIGNDKFLVPKDFNEFYDRYPNYIRNWVKKRLGKFAVEEDVEDWTQDLIIHMKYLPLTSKYRVEGKEDVVQTFNPYKLYGANEARFRSYINNCLTNKYNTMHGKRKKNPVCRPNTLSMAAQVEVGEYAVVDDEYVHQNSNQLSRQNERNSKQWEDRLFADEFAIFLQDNDKSAYEVFRALQLSGSSGEAMHDFCMTCYRLVVAIDAEAHTGHAIGMTQSEFNRARNRLKQLGECFNKGQKVPKPRKTYNKRKRVTVE